MTGREVKNDDARFWQILLQKSQIAERQFFR
jgi:hypothetical protein